MKTKVIIENTWNEVDAWVRFIIDKGFIPEVTQIKDGFRVIACTTDGIPLSKLVKKGEDDYTKAFYFDIGR